jgi:hypothetical protein
MSAVNLDAEFFGLSAVILICASKTPFEIKSASTACRSHKTADKATGIRRSVIISGEDFSAELWTAATACLWQRKTPKVSVNKQISLGVFMMNLVYFI